MKRAKMILIAVLLTMMVILIVRNQGRVQVDLLVTTVTVPRILLLLCTFLVGTVCGLLVASRLARRGK